MVRRRGGELLRVQGKVRGRAGSRGAEVSPTSAFSLSQLCAVVALPTHGEDAWISHNAAPALREGKEMPDDNH